MSELIDNRAQRIRTLKEIIRDLGRGADPESVKARLRALLGQVDSTEIAAMEEDLMAEGMRVEEIRPLCDIHAQVLGDLAAEPRPRDVAPGHPVDTFRRENAVLSEAIARFRRELEAASSREDPAALDAARRSFNLLQDVDKHYRRKEYLLFPKLERHGVAGPSKVMWAKHDEARALLAELGRALSRADAPAREVARAALPAAGRALEALEGMIYKEEAILLPLSLETLTDDEWGEIWEESPDYGWCLVEPQEGYAPPRAASPPPEAEVARDRSIRFPAGNLTLEQLVAIFSALPVDLTFVDDADAVRFFTEGPDRIFQRSKAILGRKVQHCHPPSSVHVVEKILADFRTGARDVAEFWIQFHGRFVHIRYFAVRGAAGEYLGTLEVTQDITRISKLEGERRILQYEEAPAGK